MTAPTLTLYSASLLSKWGFNDGDVPEALLDYWDDIGVPYPGGWRAVLCSLVRDHLVVEVARNHVIEVVEICTIHNPIRVSTVDGVAVDWDTSWYGPPLTPGSVTVPYAAIAHAIDDHLTLMGVVRAPEAWVTVGGLAGGAVRADAPGSTCAPAPTPPLAETVAWVPAS